MRTIVSYDISDDKRRRQVARILEGYGYRVQYSVFECDLNKKQKQALQQQLRPLVNKAALESIRFYPLPADAARRVEVMGQDLARFLGGLTIV